MCRGKMVCSELGEESARWSKRAPLPVPDWFDQQLSVFVKAVQAASLGQREEAIERLTKVRSNDLRDWFVEHGQISGRFRLRKLQRPAPDPVPVSERDEQTISAQLAKEVLERDGYRCRYCGLRVVSKSVLSAFSAVVGADRFRATGTNAERHGVVLAFRANTDHVKPWRLGGQTSEDNLVTACWSCNYGKAGHTVDQLGIEDPLGRKPHIHDWDGLVPLLPKLRKYAARPSH